MIVGVDVDHLENGKDAMLDGDAGFLILDPDLICDDLSSAACRAG